MMEGPPGYEPADWRDVVVWGILLCIVGAIGACFW